VLAIDLSVSHAPGAGRNELQLVALRGVLRPGRRHRHIRVTVLCEAAPVADHLVGQVNLLRTEGQCRTEVVPEVAEIVDVGGAERVVGVEAPDRGEGRSVLLGELVDPRLGVHRQPLTHRLVPACTLVALDRPPCHGW